MDIRLWNTGFCFRIQNRSNLYTHTYNLPILTHKNRSGYLHKQNEVVQYPRQKYNRVRMDNSSYP